MDDCWKAGKRMIPHSEVASAGSGVDDRTIRAIEYFVHPSLRRDPGLLYRTRVLIALLLMFATLTALTTTTLALVPLSGLSQTLSIGLCLLSFLGVGSLLWRLRQFGSYRFCVVAADLLVQGIIVASIAISGGIMQSPGTPLLKLPPLIAYFFGGIRGGSRSLAFSLFIAAAFVAAEQVGIRFPQIVGAEHLHTAQLMARFVDVLIVSAIAFIYELTASNQKTERDRAHQKVLALARRDALTGLANRRCLDEKLNEVLRTCSHATAWRPFVLCCIDLDGFKPVNDRHGHKVGDEVLRTIADRLLLTVRGTDVVGRRGGDEFMVIAELTGSLPDASNSSIQMLAERILSVIGRPIETSVGSLCVGASLGFACYSHDGGGAEALIRAADAAMYEAKNSGGSGWRLYHPPPSEDPLAPIDATQAGTDTLVPFERYCEAADAPRAKSRLIALLDTLVHPALRLDSAILNRARVLATALLLLSVQLAVTAAMMVLPQMQAHFQGFSVITILAVLAAILMLQALLRCTANYVLPSVATLLVLYVADLFAISNTGGVAISCCTQSLAEVPLIAYFFGGARWGNRMAVVSTASIAAFAVLEGIGWHFDNMLDNTAAGISYLLISVINAILTSGIACAYVFLARKLERERDLEQKLIVRLARTDALTGLNNRLQFDSDLRARIAAAEPRAPFSLCYLDLDGFKPINDRHGHDVGDEVLRAISERLLGCMREGDSVARYGGDEFALLLNSVGNEEEMEFTARRLLRAIASPIRTRIGMVSVQGSLGFAMFPFDGSGEDALKSAADKAMYTAKAQGGGWRSFKASLGTSAPQSFEQISGMHSGAA